MKNLLLSFPIIFVILTGTVSANNTMNSLIGKYDIISQHCIKDQKPLDRKIKQVEIKFEDNKYFINQIDLSDEIYSLVLYEFKDLPFEGWFEPISDNVLKYLMKGYYDFNDARYFVGLTVMIVKTENKISIEFVDWTNSTDLRNKTRTKCTLELSLYKN